MRTAGQIAADAGLLLWNHGGSGDDVEGAHPGHIISVLTPASRYAEPFVRRMADDQDRARLWITHGRGAFGRQVAAGAQAAAMRAGIAASQAEPGELPRSGERWGLLCAGTFEDDVETLRRARSLRRPPEVICSVAAGVREFGEEIGDAEGIFGMGQWFPGVIGSPDLGPSEASFLAAWSAVSPGVPDYPAVQAAAAAVLAVHCAQAAGGTRREMLWQVATSVNARTLFGDFRVSPDGVQVGHQSVLVRWTERGLALAP
jgi:ABC-type branched-subunit amino acid transport system substrate-binding protein